MRARRPIIGAALCLLFGALCTVVIAILAATQQPTRSFWPFLAESSVDAWYLGSDPPPPGQMWMCHEASAAGFQLRAYIPMDSETAAALLDPAPKSIDILTPSPTRFLYSAGWPVPALVGAMRRESPRLGAPETLHSLTLVEGRSGPLYLPSRPWWPGFLLDTVIFAAGPWLLFTAARVVKGVRRRLRGWCVACGYPRGAEVACPECGRGAS